MARRRKQKDDKKHMNEDSDLKRNRNGVHIYEANPDEVQGAIRDVIEELEKGLTIEEIESIKNEAMISDFDMDEDGEALELIFNRIMEKKRTSE